MAKTRLTFSPNRIALTIDFSPIERVRLGWNRGSQTIRYPEKTDNYIGNNLLQFMRLPYPKLDNEEWIEEVKELGERSKSIRDFSLRVRDLHLAKLRSFL